MTRIQKKYKNDNINHGEFVFNDKKNKYELVLGFEDKAPINRQWKNIRESDPLVTRVILDIDNDDLNEAYRTMRRVQTELGQKNYINYYFSGSKGFHVEINVKPSNVLNLESESPTDCWELHRDFLYAMHSFDSNIDTALKDIGTRIIRKPNTQHSKTGNYKVLIDPNATLEEILKHSENNKNMINPVTQGLKIEKIENIMKIFIDKFKDNEEVNEQKNNTNNSNGLTQALMSAINNIKGQHIINSEFIPAILGYADNKSVDIRSELLKAFEMSKDDEDRSKQIDGYLKNNTPHKKSYKTLKEKLPKQILNDIETQIYSKVMEKEEEEEKKREEEIKQDYEYIKGLVQEKGLLQVLKENLTRYLNNSINLSMGLAYSYLASTRQYSTVLAINGGAGGGKTAYCETIGDLVPTYEKQNIGTSASYFRQDEYYYDGKVIDMGDFGLIELGKDRKNQAQEVLGILCELVTDGKVIKPVTEDKAKEEGEEREAIELTMRSGGLCLIISQPMTSYQKRVAGAQLERRTHIIDINELTKEQKKKLFKDRKKDLNDDTEFRKQFKNYMNYLIDNAPKIKYNSEKEDIILDMMLEDCYNDMDNAKRYSLLFEAICILNGVEEVTLQKYKSFKKIYPQKSEITPIMSKYLSMIVRNIRNPTQEEINESEDHTGKLEQLIIRNSEQRRINPFFTVSSIKNQFRSNIIRNKSMKDTIGQISQILEDLEMVGAIKKLNNKYKGENAYYHTLDKVKIEKILKGG